MILAVDTCYSDDLAVVDGVASSDWTAEREDAVYRCVVEDVAPYVPGQFFRRELPGILSLLNNHRLEPDIIVVDGFVYLDDRWSPGLGRHL
jgi:deoxyribonuclease V